MENETEKKMWYRETIKNMIMDMGDKVVAIDKIEYWKDCDGAYDVICYVMPDLFLEEKELEAFGKAWVYKNWHMGAVDMYYDERYGDAEGEEREERYYDGYLEDEVDRIMEDVAGCKVDHYIDDLFETEVKHKDWWEPKVKQRNWLLDVVKDKWISKIDRMTDEMCKDIYESNINIDERGLLIGNLYKNWKTKELGIVVEINRSDWWKGSVRMLVEGEVKKISMMRKLRGNNDWKKAVA